MIERIEDITTPPVVGRFYGVPTVEAYWYNRLMPWPVMGARHADREHFDFPHEHYHIDPRFVSRRIWDSMMWWGDEAAAASTFFRTPLTGRVDWRRGSDLGPVVRRRRKCQRAMPEYPYGDKDPVQSLRRAFAGVPAIPSKRGWICPHRKAPLGSIQPDEHGVITCPLHGLRFCAKTGAPAGGMPA